MPFVRSTAPFSEPQNTSGSTTENQSSKDRPKKEIDFPLSDPKYSLDDMIITDEVKEELSTIIEAEKCWKRVFEDWGLAEVMGDRRNLFVNLYGYPGTGKTMAAHAIAKAIGKKMICVNYAEIESKYVGETSKNLTRLFKTAAEKNAVIFFDEADAFLSKRVTNMNNSTDVSVNQTRSVLLTLLNDFNGVIIFATNFLSNYDSAFMRRIQYHVKFELPNKELREKLWRRYIPSKMPADIDFKPILSKPLSLYVPTSVSAPSALRLLTTHLNSVVTRRFLLRSPFLKCASERWNSSQSPMYVWSAVCSVNSISYFIFLTSQSVEFSLDTFQHLSLLRGLNVHVKPAVVVVEVSVGFTQDLSDGELGNPAAVNSVVRAGLFVVLALELVFFSVYCDCACFPHLSYLSTC